MVWGQQYGRQSAFIAGSGNHGAAARSIKKEFGERRGVYDIYRM